MDGFANFFSETAYDNFPPEIANLIKTGNFNATQIRYLKKIPWGNTESPEIDIVYAKETLEASHYGMQPIKDQILRYIACQKHLGLSYGDVLLLVGPPGVGKTSIAESIAIAMKRKFFKISLAGMSDAGPLRGYDTNYQSPKPGRIVEGIIQTGTFSPLILLDEIDKMGSSSNNGDPAYVLLDILDSNRSRFIDDLISVPIDLSNIVFVATANSLQALSPILLNRLEIIKLKGYTREEKIIIANKYLIPSLIKDYRIEDLGVEFTKELIEYIIDNHAHEPGIRALKRLLKLAIESVITETYLGNTVSSKISIAEFNRLTHNDSELEKKLPNKNVSKRKKLKIPLNYD